MTIGYPRPPNDDEQRRIKEKELKEAARKHDEEVAETHASTSFFGRLFHRRSDK